LLSSLLCSFFPPLPAMPCHAIHVCVLDSNSDPVGRCGRCALYNRQQSVCRSAACIAPVLPSIHRLTHSATRPTDSYLPSPLPLSLSLSLLSWWFCWLSRGGAGRGGACIAIHTHTHMCGTYREECSALRCMHGGPVVHDSCFVLYYFCVVWAFLSPRLSLARGILAARLPVWVGVVWCDSVMSVIHLSIHPSIHPCVRRE